MSAQDEIARLENLLEQAQLGVARTEDLIAAVGEDPELARMLAGLQQQVASTTQQMQALGGTPDPNAGGLLAEGLPPPGMPPQQPQPQQQQMPPQGGGGLLADPSQQQMPGFQPTMTPQMMHELYGIMAAGADDPNQIGMNYVQRMQYNDMLKNQALTQASQARTSGFNPIVDDEGYVWFPKRQQDGTTGLSPALDDKGEQIRTDPRFSTIDMGGGSTARIQTSGGARGTGPEVLTTPGQVQANVGTAADIERRQKAKRALPGLENVFAREGGAYDTVSKLIDHPAREWMTGGTAPLGFVTSYIPGADSQEFRTLEEKLGSQAFINAIMELRSAGGTVGQITEREGDKLQAAGIALNRAAQEGDYLQELQNFQMALARFMMAARVEAGEEDPFSSTIGEAGVDLNWIRGGQTPTIEGLSPRQQELLEKARGM